MTKVTVELDYEQIDSIVVQELQSQFRSLVSDLNANVAVFDTREELVEVIDAFKKVIEHNMVYFEYDKFIAEFTEEQLQ